MEPPGREQLQRGLLDVSLGAVELLEHQDPGAITREEARQRVRGAPVLDRRKAHEIRRLEELEIEHEVRDAELPGDVADELGLADPRRSLEKDGSTRTIGDLEDGLDARAQREREARLRGGAVIRGLRIGGAGSRHGPALWSGLGPGAAWFLDNGAGSNRFAGTFRGMGANEAPLHLVRVDLVTGAVSLTEVCGLPGGLIANPPAIDPVRRIAVAYDSGNGVVAAFRFDAAGATTPLWRCELNHGAHPLRFPESGELVLCDHDAVRNVDQVVVIDIETGHELARADTGSPIQSVLFLAPGFERDLYYCSFTTVARISA